MNKELALLLAAEGLRFWANWQERAAKGQISDDELDAMATRLDVNLDGLRADIAAAKAEGR